jgi:hypothetical protein
MKLDTKKILTIGAGAVVGYLIFCKFMKSDAQKSSEGGAIGEEAPAEEGGIGGSGGSGGFGGSVAPLPPVIAPIITPIPVGYVSLGNNTLAPLSGLNPNKPSEAVVNISTTPETRATPPTPPPATSRPPITDVTGAPVSAVNKVKFADFDGDANFQDQLL